MSPSGAGPAVRSAAPVPVLLYHSVCEEPPAWIAPFTVRPRAFARQLDLLADRGVAVVPLSRLVAAQRSPAAAAALPARCAVLTFDDGFADFHTTVAPLLAARGLTATLYLTTGAVRRPGRTAGPGPLPPAAMLDWDRVRELDAAGFEIGGHTATHPQLDTLPPAALAPEIEGCRRRIEDELGHRVTAFAYPHGYSGPAVRRRTARAGWTSAAAVRQGFSSAADEPLRIARLMLRADTGPAEFARWAAGEGAPVAPFPEGARTRGWRAWRRLRARLRVPCEALPPPHTAGGAAARG
ncbi:polysaccharide deacetylase family protein [Streptomyces sp. NPDC048001]|uniref:polysaccharide deacetylase family protein n=1 Tax=Streptomyces sp. NPDC048001 TaxID=3365498 RepID=UPI00371DAB6D